MFYLFRLLLVFGITTVSLSSTELHELKNNFYIRLDSIQLNSFETNENEKSFARGGYLYGLGYLHQFNNFYLGASLTISPEDKLNYMIISENNKNVDIQQKRDLQIALQAKYNFFEFENIKMLIGIELGYQLNSLSLNYRASKKQTVREEQKQEFSVGDIIDKNFWRQCAFSGGNENVDWNYESDQGKVIGNGVYCTTYHSMGKEIEYSEKIELMQASLPISLSLSMLYGLTENVDLGIGAGLSIIENINIKYTDNFINLNHKQSLSYYNLHLLINYKFN